MRPMDHPALRVPFVFPIECNGISLAQAGYPGRQINVVSHKDSLAGRQLHYKALVLASVCIVGEEFLHYSLILHLDVAFAFLKSAFEREVAGRHWPRSLT